MEELEYGPIICTGGPFKGRIGYLEDTSLHIDLIGDCSNCKEECPCRECDLLNDPDQCDDCDKSNCPEYGEVYWNSVNYDLVPLKYCSNKINKTDLAKRINKIKTLLHKRADNNDIEVTEELEYVTSLLYQYQERIPIYCEKKGLKLFISHSSKDKWFANFLYSSLVEAGQNPWLDQENILGGQSILTKIAEGIDDSDFMILILSKNSVASEWVSAEWESFLTDEVEQGKVKIIPVLIGKCKIPRFLKSKKYIDFTRDYNEGFRELLRPIQQ